MMKRRKPTKTHWLSTPNLTQLTTLWERCTSTVQDYPQARDWFKRHLARSPKSSLRLYDLGNALMQMKEYAKAADAYSAAIDNSHSFTEAHYNLAVCFARTGRMDEARQIYNWLLDKTLSCRLSAKPSARGKQAD